MNAKKAKKLRRRAKLATQNLENESYVQGNVSSMRMLHNCTKGAYRALKRNKVRVVED